jgi:hypothetical protein
MSGNPNITASAGSPVTADPMFVATWHYPITIYPYITAMTYFPSAINPYVPGRRRRRTYHYRRCRAYFNHYLCRCGCTYSNYQYYCQGYFVNDLFHTIKFSCSTITCLFIGALVKMKV